MRVRPDNFRMNEGRALASAAIRYCSPHYSQRVARAGAVASLQVKIGKVFDQPGNIAAGSLHLDGHADRVAVIFQQEEHRELEIAGRVESFPKLTFAGRSISKRNVDHFVFLKV